MLHSGSRNVGNQTAMHHDKVAAGWLQDSSITAPTGLNYVPIKSEHGQQYLQACARHAAHGSTCAIQQLETSCCALHSTSQHP